MIKLYHLVMDSRHNPLSHIPDTNTRHLVMQVLAWMWCIVFSMWMGSILVFGVSAAIHAILFAGIFVTVGVFETAKRKPVYFGGLGESQRRRARIVKQKSCPQISVHCPTSQTAIIGSIQMGVERGC